MTEPLLGEFGVVRTDGWAGRLIRWGTRSNVNHAFVYVGDNKIVEAQPGGAIISPLKNYPHTLWSDYPLLPYEREAVAGAALRLVGTPYSWVDVVSIGIAKVFRFHVPEGVRKRLRRKDRLMCSQLVDTAYLQAGIHLFQDGRLPGDVSPSDLADLVLGAKE